MDLRRLTTAVAIVLLGATTGRATAAEVAAYFSPADHVAAKTSAAIDGARSRVLVMAYSLSEHQITAALIAAKRRGVNVEAIVDPGQESAPYTTAAKLAAAGVRVYTDHQHQLMHNKTVLIDDKTVITGSANLTASGNKLNAENIVIIQDAATAARYAADWLQHRQHSQPYTARRPRHADDSQPARPVFNLRDTPTTKEY